MQLYLMCGQLNYTIDDMNEILLNTGVFEWNGYTVKLLNNNKVYEVYKEENRVLRVATNWSSYFLIEDMISQEK